MQNMRFVYLVSAILYQFIDFKSWRFRLCVSNLGAGCGDRQTWVWKAIKNISITKTPHRR